MPPYAVAVTMERTFRGQPEQFSNVWHYDLTFPIGTGEPLADAVVAGQKGAFPTSVQFKTVRVWGPTDEGAAASETILVKDLSGGGTGSFSGGSFYSELAVVCQFYLGRSSTSGRKRFLRKFIHSGQLRVTTGTILGDSPLSTAEKDAWKSWMNGMKNLTFGSDSAPICAPNGDHLPLLTDAEVLPYLHVRQFKQ